LLTFRKYDGRTARVRNDLWLGRLDAADCAAALRSPKSDGLSAPRAEAVSFGVRNLKGDVQADAGPLPDVNKSAGESARRYAGFAPARWALKDR
jgi:hypothetical protein